MTTGRLASAVLLVLALSAAGCSGADSESSISTGPVGADGERPATVDTGLARTVEAVGPVGADGQRPATPWEFDPDVWDVPPVVAWDPEHQVAVAVNRGRVVPPEGVFVDVSVTNWRSCGVRDSGKVVCWGGEAPGEWLEGGLARVAAGSSCALGAQGELLCWRADYRVSDGSAVNHLMEAPRGQRAGLSI